MAEKNLGNAAFFAIKGLKKELDEVKKRLQILEKAFLASEEAQK